MYSTYTINIRACEQKQIAGSGSSVNVKVLSFYQRCPTQLSHTMLQHSRAIGNNYTTTSKFNVSASFELTFSMSMSGALTWAVSN